MGNPGCPLKKLSLKSCHVDDMQLQCFLSALIKDNLTSKLTILDLSRNKLGGSDQMNSKKQTTGDMLAQWIKNRLYILESLNLSWNMMRSTSSVSFGHALSTNKSLLHLDLSYNALGREGGIAIGSA